MMTTNSLLQTGRKFFAEHEHHPKLTIFQVHWKVQSELVDGAHCLVQIIATMKWIPFVAPTEFFTKMIVIEGSALVDQVCDFLQNLGLVSNIIC